MPQRTHLATRETDAAQQLSDENRERKEARQERSHRRSRCESRRADNYLAKPRTCATKALTTSVFSTRSGFGGIAALLPTAPPPFLMMFAT